MAGQEQQRPDSWKAKQISRDAQDMALSEKKAIEEKSDVSIQKVKAG